MSVAVAAVLSVQVGPAVSVVLAVVAGTTFAASLWLVDRDRWRVPATALAGALSLVVGSAVAVAVGVVVLDLVSQFYPVSAVSQIRPRGLRLASATLVVGGSAVAVVGGLASVGSVLRRETTTTYAELSVETFFVVLGAGVLLAAPAISASAGGTPVDPVLDPVVGVVDAVLGALFLPVPFRTHLFTFVVVGLLTTVSLRLALARLPVRTLPAGPRRERVGSALALGRTRLRQAAMALGAVLPLTLVEFAVSQFELAALLGPLYGPVVTLTAAQWLRTVAFLTITASLAVVLAVELLGRVAGTPPRELAAGSTPFVGGAAVVVVVFATHGFVVEPSVSFVADHLPAAFATGFERQADDLVFFFGSAVVGLFVAAVLVGLTAAGSLALAIGATLASFPDRATGPALAATGLFVATAFAGAVGVDPPLVLAGLVAVFVVWDAGEFGARLGREVGSARARGPVVAHVGATVALGAVLVLGVRLTMGLGDWVPVVTGPALPVAFAVVVLAFAVTAIALR